MNTKITIQPEKNTELKEIYTLIQTAFQTAKVKDGDEQDFAERLRKNSGYLPELALTAKINEKLIGHILITLFPVTTSKKKLNDTLLLGPISVLLEYRNQGIGSLLINKSLEKARKIGYRAVFLCGDPDYYHRFGFLPTSMFGIQNINNIPEINSMVCELYPNALQGIHGTINFSV